ncbi:tripartite tricarboxylate transporter TctB family protein [Alphaproteobacteria bacterium]|jgi:putative tricarboxylic transport membrane protein|nr:tripartite tricarboxylate transporter TctB family protein [Alphaproteobacteria bacterium]
MKVSADRLSGCFCVLLGLAMIFAIIPTYVEGPEDGSIAPATLPNILSWIIVVCGGFLVIKPTGHQTQDMRFFISAAAYAAVLAGAIYAMTLLGFVYVAPVLALVIMLMIGERRPLWLGFGVAGMPALIFIFVELLLDRSLP